MKKLLVLLVLGLFLVTGCDSEPQQIERANGDSLTYLFFKDKYEESKYYFEFLDRNTAKNDSTKIIMARNDDNYYYDIIRKNIKEYRKKANLTQQQLADKAGISMNYIAKIESKKMQRGFTIVVAGRIADALGIDIRLLFKN